MSEVILGIRFQGFKIMNNLISGNLIPPKFMYNFSSYEHLKGWDTSHFKGDIFRKVPSSNPFLYTIREPKYNQINLGHDILRH